MDFESMNDEQLRAEIRQRGWPLIPLTPTNRKLMIKKLKNISDIFCDSCEDSVKESVKESIKESIIVNKTDLDNSKIFQSPIADENQDSFIGVNNGDGSTPIVVRTVKQALSFIKSSPASRFKCFKSFEEAESFSKSPPLLICDSSFNQLINNSNIKNNPGINFGISEVPNNENFKINNSVKESNNYSIKDPDPTNLFPSIKPQQLNFFKNLFKNNNILDICKLINSNPKYLITSLDAPTVIHEGFHRNSLHVAAFFNKPDIVNLILSHIKNIFNISNFYSIKNPINNNIVLDKCNRILELFLNSPEKACLETPLHIACKYGFYEIVKILLDEPLMDRSIKNFFNEIAFDIICTRYTSDDVDKCKNNIKNLFKNNYFVCIFPDINNNIDVTINTSPKLMYDNAIGIVGPTTEKNAIKIESLIKNAEVCDNINLYIRTLAKKYDCNFWEYLKFIGCFVNLSSKSSYYILEKFLEIQKNQYHIFESSKIEESFIQDSLIDKFNSLSFHSISMNIDNSFNSTNLGFLTIYSVFYSKWNDPLLEEYLKTVFRGAEISKNDFPNLASFLYDRSYL